MLINITLVHLVKAHIILENGVDPWAHAGGDRVAAMRDHDA